METPHAPHVNFYATIRTMVRHNIAGLPVLNADGTPPGIISFVLV